MIGGIFETIGKTLGVGKEKYFLELDDAAGNSVKALKKTASKAVDTAKDVAGDVTDVVDTATDKAKAAAVDVLSTAENVGDAAAGKAKAVAKDAKVAAQKGKKSAKKTAQKVEKAAKAATKEKSPGKKTAPQKAAAKKAAPAKSAGPTPEELIVNAIAAGGRKLDSSGQVVDGATTFATDYLLPSPTSRRRPGPSLDKFKSMSKKNS